MAKVADAAETVKKAIAHAMRFGADLANETSAATDFYPYFFGYPHRPHLLMLTEILNFLNSRAIDLHRPLRVLNLGCRTGLVTQAIALAGHRALGIDSDRQRIKNAQVFSQQEKLDGIFLQADPLRDPLWERPAEEILGGKPDAVVMVDFLNSIPQVEYFIDRISRWLPSGSLLLVGEPNPKSLSAKLRRLLFRFARNRQEESRKSFESWHKLLSSHEFVVADSILGFDRFTFLSRPFARASYILFHATKQTGSTE